MPGRNLAELRREAVACLGDFVGFPPVSETKFPEGFEAQAITIDPSGQLAALSSGNGNILVSELAAGKEVARLATGGRLQTLRFTATGDRLVALASHGAEGQDQQLSSSVLHVFGHKTDARWVEVEHLAVPGAYAVLEANDTLYTAVAEENGQVLQLLNPRDGAVYCRIDTQRKSDRPPLVSLSPDGALLAVAVPGAGQSRLCEVEIWDAKTRRLLGQVLPGISVFTFLLSFVP